jgi:hypothetical protein
VLEQRGHSAGHGGSVPLWPSFVDGDHYLVDAVHRT